MSLPSQSARTASPGRTQMTRKGKPSPRTLIAASGAVLVIAVAGWALTRNGEGHEQVSPPPLAAAPAAEHPAPEVTPEAPAKVMAVDAPKPDPVPPPVFELRQGAGQPSIVPTSAPVVNTPSPTTPTPPSEPTASQAAPIIQNPPSTAQLDPGTSGLPTDLAATLGAARAKDGERDWIAARMLYSQALADARLSEVEKAGVRDRLKAINDELVFSPKVTTGDPFSEFYTIQGGDVLIKIAQKVKMAPDWRLLQRINRLSNPGSISVGQKLKVIREPFHAVVNKSAYRMDVFLGPAGQPQQWVYVRSFRVGLGDPEKHETTPLGNFIVKKGSKMVDPPWTNPKTGERFGGGDPKNPIGKHWIGLEGQGEASAYTGYGIHGTIDPDSIGQQRSMGCVRMMSEDVALVYELLTEQGSSIEIRP